ncbi:hypothetical protein B296_00055773 [Ensete ventricosum]|uniref:BHLH domain-containing protein n=1 Tax=Ensete ventricosum TaxID=4639 RepID=A0A426XC58_ENSVE|nr:hypothetical protein B296_00055773 [Ensete ventricosum]
MSIPEIGEDVNCDSSSDEATAHVEQSFISGNFQLTSWDDSNSIMFSAPRKRTRDDNEDMLTSLSNTDSQERRTRISKRLQKLHNLVPSMDKLFDVLQQTSTSDMLELAIQYIKELQSQVQVCLQ